MLLFTLIFIGKIFLFYFIYEETDLKKGDLSKSIMPFVSGLEAHTLSTRGPAGMPHSPEPADLGLAEG